MNFKVTFKEETPPFNVKFGWNNGEFEAGKAEGAKSEYDRFWDVYQENGNMTYYAYAFAGVGWTQSVFKPKYNIGPVTPTSMFSSSRIVDIRPQTIGVDVDFSKCTSFYYLCSNSTIKYIGVVDCSSAQPASLSYIFSSAKELVSVEKVIMPEMDSAGFADKSFENAVKLEHIRIEGVIHRSTSLRWSPLLSKASMESMINALSDTAEGQTITFSQAAKQAVFTDAEWAALIGTKPNWTFSLA